MILTQELIKQHFRYEPETGLFFRHIKTGRENKDGSSGFNSICINKRTFTKGQAAWVYMTGKLPPLGQIVSFRNKDREDFRFDNLYLTTRTKLQLGVGLPFRKTNLPIGVRIRKDVNVGRRRFVACARINSTTYRIGTFTTAKAAGVAYQTAIEQYNRTGTFMVYRRKAGPLLIDISRKQG